MAMQVSRREVARSVVFPAFGRPGAGSDATITVSVVGSWTVLEAAGDLGWTVTRGLRELLLATPSARVVVDLTRVSRLDHDSLAVLAHAHRTKRSLGGCVRLVAPPRSVLTPLLISGTFDLPPVFCTLDEAVA